MVAIILMGNRELVALLGLSSWCLVIVVWLSRAALWVCLRFVNVAFPDHTHYFVILQGGRPDTLSPPLDPRMFCLNL